MVAWTFIFFAVSMFIATTTAAPSESKDGVIVVPAECEGKLYCTIKPEGYDNLVEKMNSLLPKVLKDEQNIRKKREAEVEKTRKQISLQGDWHNCPYITENVSLYTYFDPLNYETYLVVQTEQFKQTFEMAYCAYDLIHKNDDDQCFQHFTPSLFGMKSKCETNYIRRNLYVLDRNGMKIVLKRIYVPISCSCKITY